MREAMAEKKECNHLLHELSEYIDGTLEPELCLELEKHLATCDNCRIVVNTTRKTIELYQETGEEVQMPEAVRRRLFERLNLQEYQAKQE
jgi:anti-sigma factor RsiW